MSKDWPYPGIAPEANPNTILTLTLTLTRGLILDNAERLPWYSTFGPFKDISETVKDVM